MDYWEWASDPKWSTRSAFDDPFDDSRLRAAQNNFFEPIWALEPEIEAFEAGIDAEGRPNSFFRCLTGGNIVLLPGVTGTGKTVLEIAFLHWLATVIGVGRPRPRRGLVLAPESKLCASLEHEFKSDCYDLGMVKNRLGVYRAEGWEDLLDNGGKTEFTFSTVQTLWEVNRKQSPRSMDDKRKILEMFDFVIYDEVDWGHAEIQTIANIAVHAVQLGLTASLPFNFMQQEEE